MPTTLEWWEIDAITVDMGAQGEYRYDGEDSTFMQRMGRCYELAGRTFLLPERYPDDLPEPRLLVHGTWTGPVEESNPPIGHAWVVLSDERIWEPITAVICDPDRFIYFTGAKPEAVYEGEPARRRMFRHHHFGPWHIP